MFNDKTKKIKSLRFLLLPVFILPLFTTFACGYNSSNKERNKITPNKDKDFIEEKDKIVPNKDIANLIKSIFNKSYLSQLENRKINLPSSLIKGLDKKNISVIFNKLGFNYSGSHTKFANLLDLTADDKNGEILLKISFKFKDIDEFSTNLIIFGFCTSSEWENDYKPAKKVFDYFKNEIGEKTNAGLGSEYLDYFLNKINQKLNPWDFDFKNNFSDFIKTNNVLVEYYLSGHGLQEQRNQWKESSASGSILLTVRIQKNNFKKQTKIQINNLKIQDQKQVTEVSEKLFPNKFDINFKTFNKFKEFLPSDFILEIKKLNLISDKYWKRIFGNQIYSFWKQMFKFDLSSWKLIFKDFMNANGEFWFRNFVSDDESGQLTFELVVIKGKYWKVNQITVDGFSKSK